MTYPLYLIHQVVGALFLGALIRAGVSPYAAILIVLAGVVAISWIIATYIEPQVRGLLRKRLDAVWPTQAGR